MCVNVLQGTTAPPVGKPAVTRLVNMVADVCPEITALVHMATWDQDVKLWCVTDIVKMVESVCRLMSVSVNLAGTDQRVIQPTVNLCV